MELLSAYESIVFGKTSLHGDKNVLHIINSVIGVPEGAQTIH